MRILIAVPTGRDIHFGLATFLAAESKKPDVGIFIGKAYGIEGTGFKKVFDEIAIQKADFSIIIQADIEPPKGMIEKLVSCDLPVVVPPIIMYEPLKYSGDLMWNAQTAGNGQEHRRYNRGHGIERIAHSSSSCICIRKDVLEVFEKAGEHLIQPSGIAITPWPEPDQTFFAKLMVLGIPAYCNWGIQGVIHHHNVELCDIVLERWRSRGSAIGNTPGS